MTEDVLARLERLLGGGGEPDDLLRDAVALVAAQPGVAWAGIAFLDEGRLALGPTAGHPDESQRMSVPIVFHDSHVGELLVDGRADQALLDRVAALLADLVLIGWDTGGEVWDP